MSAPKDAVRRLLDQLSDEASLEDIQYHIHIRQKIDRGLDDIETGRTMSEEDLEKRLTRWLKP